MSELAVAYIRVSTEDQDKGYSKPRQVELISELAKREGLELKQVFEDSMSGDALPRPGMDLLLAYLSQADPKISRVLVMCADRLARDIMIMYVIKYNIQVLGARIQYALNDYGADSRGQLLEAFDGIRASTEKQDILRRTVDGKYTKAAHGHVVNPGRMPPYGYEYISEPKKGHFVIIEDEAGVVRIIYRWYVYGFNESEAHLHTEYPVGKPLTIKAIADALYAASIPTKSDSWDQNRKAKACEWHRSTVKDILQNRIYIGEWIYGRKGNGKHAKVVVKVPSIIDEDLFNAAQERKAKNKVFNPRNRKHEYLISALARCGVCGCKMYGHTGSRMVSHYMCATQLWGDRSYRPRCDSPCFNVKQIDDMAWTIFAAAMQHPDQLEQGIRERQSQKSGTNSVILDRVAQIDKSLADLKKKETRLLNGYINELFTLDDVTVEKRAIESQRTRLDSERQALNEQMEATVTEAEITEFMQLVELISDGVELFSFAEKRHWMEEFDVEAVLKDENGEKQVKLSIDINGLRVPLNSNGYVER